jgi:hypothetical protein
MTPLTQVKKVPQAILVPFLCVTSLVREGWMEGLLGCTPDDHSGLLESLPGCALVLGFLACRGMPLVRGGAQG